MATGDGQVAAVGAAGDVGWLEEGEEECSGLEPFFFDGVAVRAEHAAAEAAKEKMREEAARKQEIRDRRREAHMAVENQIRDYDEKQGGEYYNRFCFADDFSKFDLNKESSIGPMRYTNRICKPGKRPYELCEAINILYVDIASSDVGYPINVYGTVIARDSIDLKCVYLFRRDRDHCQTIKSEEESLILTGPKRGLALIDDAYVEIDLKIKDDNGEQDRELSKGFVTIDGMARRWLTDCVVEYRSLDTRLSTVDVIYGVVKDAVEATIAIEVVHGDFYGDIAAFTTSIKDCLMLHDSDVAGARTGKGAMELSRAVVAVYLKEALFVSIVAQTGCGGGEAEGEIEFTPKVNGGDEEEITVGGATMLVKVVWSIIDL